MGELGIGGVVVVIVVVMVMGMVLVLQCLHEMMLDRHDIR